MATYFTMKGSGAFPIDMLRYDECYPANSNSVAAIEQKTFGMREVQLVKRGREGITIERWSSFNWHVTHMQRN